VHEETAMSMMGPMPEDNPVTTAWNAHQTYLVDLAFRMLGDIGNAEDVVQEAFSRLMRADIDHIEDPRGWLIVVTSRLCLDQIGSARARRELAEDSAVIDEHGGGPSLDPADRITLDDNVRLALLVVLQRLSPAERVVFVLHDIFQIPFETVAETVGRSPASCRQLARRARMKVDNAGSGRHVEIDNAAHRLVTEKFILACSTGSLEGLLEVLDPEASGEVDLIEGLVVVGAGRVANNLLRFWSEPSSALVAVPVGGQPAVLAFSGRTLIGVLELTIAGTRVTEVHAIVDPATLDLLRSELAAVG
jgi:RNA polymerase sigma-70 factor (ECF subfamily)